MPTSVTLPALGESVTEGTVTRWLKQVGDNVEADEPLLEVSTDKVDTEIPSPAAGVLLEITAQEDETVEVGAVLGLIGDASEAVAAGDGSGSPPAVEEQPDAQPPVTSDSGVDGQATPAPPSPADEQSATEAAPPATQSAGGEQVSGTEVPLPALGESVTEGTVTRWLKQVGDEVAADEALLEVSTDKVDTEIPSPVSGVLLEVRVREDETVEVGSVLAVVGEPGAATAEPEPRPQPEPEPAPQIESEAQPEAEVTRPEAQPEAAEARTSPPAAEPQQPAATAPTPTASATTATSAAAEADAGYVTPLVRKLAKEHGIDLCQVNRPDVVPRIRKEDVLAAAEAARSAAAEAAKAAAAPAAPEAPAASPTPAVTPAAAGA